MLTIIRLIYILKFKIIYLFLCLNLLIYIIINNLHDTREEINNFIESHNSKTNLSKINACIFILVKNNGLKDLINTMEQFDKQFNHRYNYPYVLINDQEFTHEFKNTVRKHTKSLVEFGKIPTDQWKIPEWINNTELEIKLNTTLKSLRYGTQITYHHMCRYYSGFFYRHELTLKYDYYLRIDPHVEFPCKIENNPFETLSNLSKLYGFIITRKEQMKTIPTLWRSINEWLYEKKYNQLMPNDNSIEFLSNDKGVTINDCHFWNNFEIGSFSIFRNKIYQSFFDFLDRKGGFYYERWGDLLIFIQLLKLNFKFSLLIGDAPVHTYYVILMLKKSQIHRFHDISYGHSGIFNWPFKNIITGCDKSKKMNIAEYGNCTNYWDLLSLFY
jgi:alpha 1,2-mannosyltransferase